MPGSSVLGLYMRWDELLIRVLVHDSLCMQILGYIYE